MATGPPATTTVPTAERNAAVDAFVTALKIPITYGAFDAHYRIDLDHIFMPPFEAFDDAASFVGTEIHECAHATGAKHRLNRDFGARFANEARSIEEITAELTAGFILADLGIAHHPRADHASYIASWLTLLKDSPRAIFTAASQAQAAADWMHAQQPNSSNAADEVPSGNCFKIMRRDDSSVADSVAPRFSGKGRER